MIDQGDEHHILHPTLNDFDLYACNPVWQRSGISIVDWKGRTRTITILSPPGVITRNRRIVSIYAHDGGDYDHATGMQNLAANRAHSADSALYRLILIPPADRMAEYFLSADNANWIHHQLIPTIEQRTNHNNAPADRVMIGASLGGLAAIYYGTVWPKDFARIIEQSSSLQMLTAAQKSELVSKLTHNNAGLILDLTAGFYETASLHDRNQDFQRELAQSALRASFRAFHCQNS